MSSAFAESWFRFLLLATLLTLGATAWAYWRLQAEGGTRHLVIAMSLTGVSSGLIATLLILD